MHSQSQYHTAKPNNKRGRCGRKAVACAECKRSKLKCEGSYPCAACIKRGCEDICPDRTLVPTKSTIHLKDKKENLQSFVRKQQKRIKELEAALRDTHGFLSSNPHPLLKSESSLYPTSAPTNLDNSGANQTTEPDISDLLDSFGSLTIDNKGQTSYHGSSSTVEHMLRTIVPGEVEEVTSPVSPVESATGALPKYIETLSNAFPYGTIVSNNARKDILKLLPDEATATSLTDIYFGSASSIFPPVDEAEFRASVLQEIYMYSERKELHKICYHKLSALFLVLGFGAYYKDPSEDIEKRREKADRYSQLSRASMSIEGTVVKTNVWTVATFLILVQFSTSIEWRKSDERWTISGFIVQSVYKIGMHLDPSHWGLSETETQNRRALYWEAILVEHWIAIAYGRPSGFDVSFADCRFAQDMEPDILDNGDIELGFKAYNHRIFAIFISRIVVHIFSTRPSDYHDLLRIEKSFRDFKCPTALRCPTTGDGDPVDGVGWSSDPKQAFRQYYANVYFKECTLLYAHRRYVVRALKLNRSDPLQTKYKPSVLGSIKSSTILLGTLKSLLGKHLNIVSRVAFFWTSAFSALFVLGSLVYVSPRCEVARLALETFEDGVRMFEEHREKDRLGQLSTDLLVKLRNHIRNLFVGLIREGFSSIDSKTEVAMTLIQLLEGGSGLVNTDKFFSLRGASPESEFSSDTSATTSPINEGQSYASESYSQGQEIYECTEYVPCTNYQAHESYENTNNYLSGPYPTELEDGPSSPYTQTNVPTMISTADCIQPQYQFAENCAVSLPPQFWGPGWHEPNASTQHVSEPSPVGLENLLTEQLSSIPAGFDPSNNAAWQAIYPVVRDIWQSDYTSSYV